MSLKLVWEVEEDDRSVDTLLAFPTDSATGTAQEKSIRKEVLVPRTRYIGTWIEGMAANITVEWSEEDVQRHQATKVLTRQRLNTLE